MGMTLYTPLTLYTLKGVCSKNRKYEGYFSCQDLQFEHVCNVLFIGRSLKLTRKQLFDIESKGLLRFFFYRYRDTKPFWTWVTKLKSDICWNFPPQDCH